MLSKRLANLCFSRDDFRGRKTTIVSDSKVAVDWINDDGPGNLAQLDIILDIRNKLSFMANTVIVFNPRGSNSFVDLLAN